MGAEPEGGDSEGESRSAKVSAAPEVSELDGSGEQTPSSGSPGPQWGNAAQSGDEENTASEREPAATGSGSRQVLSESDQEVQQWLNRVPDDPGGLLREKLRRRYAEKRMGAARGERR